MADPRPSLLCLGFLSILAGCTADPISRGLLVASPHAEAAVVRREPERVDVEAATAADRANADAVRAALRGHYDQALERLPAPGSAERPITRTALRNNRDVISYWRQRRWFAGSLAMPDPHVGIGLGSELSSLTAPGFHRRFVRMTQTLEVDAAGLRVRVPYDTVLEGGEREGFRGETELTLQAFAGKASHWPNTKLTGGVIALIHRSALCASPDSARADLFAGIAHRRGVFAGTVVVGFPTDMGVCPGPCFVGGDVWMRSGVNLLVHDYVQPTLGASAAAWVVDGHGAVVSISPGLRFFLDRRQSLRLDAMQHTTFAEVEDVHLRRLGAEVSLAYRWW